MRVVRLPASILLLSALLPAHALGQDVVWMSDLVVRDGLYYERLSRTPFSGEVRGRGFIKGGKFDGPWIFTDENGQRLSEGRYEDGKRGGPWVFFHPNGQMASRGAFEDGKRTGAWTYFHDNGTRDPDLSGVYRDGERVRE